MKVMKRLYMPIFAVLSLTLCLSCGGGDSNTGKVDERAYQVSDVSRPSEYRMQESLAQGNASMNGAEYQYRVNRKPSDELPKVKDEQGNTYVDNVIVLEVIRSEKKILTKRFTKKDFASLVEAKFLANAILEGLVFDRVVDGRLRFAASVCYPQTDLFVPLCLTVGADGNVRIEKGSILEDEIPGRGEVN